MNRKFVIAWIVLFVAWFLGSFVVHGVLLNADYLRLGMLFRAPADSQRYFPLMILAHVMLAGAFAWIYARGVERKPWLGQGVRFGIAVAFLTTIPTYLILRRAADAGGDGRQTDRLRRRADGDPRSSRRLAVSRRPSRALSHLREVAAAGKGARPLNPAAAAAALQVLSFLNTGGDP